MDNTALFRLSYGVFMLATRSGEKINGCITNTCMQVANSPTRIAIACINTNYTCDLIKESGVFCLSLLDKSCSFDTLVRWGFQSGRNADKFAGMELPEDGNGVPYLTWGTCAMISAKVVDSMDLGSHTLFIGEVLDAKVLSDREPMTYAYYQSDVKPKPQKPAVQPKAPKAWKCRICGYVYEGEKLPDDFLCPLCGHPAEDFEPVY